MDWKAKFFFIFFFWLSLLLVKYMENFFFPIVALLFYVCVGVQYLSIYNWENALSNPKLNIQPEKRLLKIQQFTTPIIEIGVINLLNQMEISSLFSLWMRKRTFFFIVIAELPMVCMFFFISLQLWHSQIISKYFKVLIF